MCLEWHQSCSWLQLHQSCSCLHLHQNQWCRKCFGYPRLDQCRQSGKCHRSQCSQLSPSLFCCRQLDQCWKTFQCEMRRCGGGDGGRMILSMIVVDRLPIVVCQLDQSSFYPCLRLLLHHARKAEQGHCLSSRRWHQCVIASCLHQEQCVKHLRYHGCDPQSRSPNSMRQLQRVMKSCHHLVRFLVRLRFRPWRPGFGKQLQRAMILNQIHLERVRRFDTVSLGDLPTRCVFVDEMFPASYGSPAAVLPVLPETGSSLFEVPIPSAFLIDSIVCDCCLLIS